MLNKKRFVEFEHVLEGTDAAVLDSIVRKFDVRYEELGTGYTYYRLKANKKDVKKITKDLIRNGYYAILADNKLFTVYERAN